MSATVAATPPLPSSGPAVLVLVGPPGSGKSTLAASYAAHGGEDVRVLSLDAYRARLSKWGEEADQAVTPCAIGALHTDLAHHLDAGRPAIVDATHARAKDRKKLLRIARDHAAVTSAVLVLPPVSVCQERNARRDATVGACGYARQVPAAVVASMHAAITVNRPLDSEDWDTVTDVSPGRMDQDEAGHTHAG